MCGVLCFPGSIVTRTAHRWVWLNLILAQEEQSLSTGQSVLYIDVMYRRVCWITKYYLWISYFSISSYWPKYANMWFIIIITPQKYAPRCMRFLPSWCPCSVVYMSIANLPWYWTLTVDVLYMPSTINTTEYVYTCQWRSRVGGKEGNPPQFSSEWMWHLIFNRPFCTHFA